MTSKAVQSTLCHQRRSFGHQFSRSLAAGLHGMGIDFSEAKRYSLRGSITKVLGLKTKQDKISPSSSSENSSIVSLSTFPSHQYHTAYSPPHISHRTLSQLSMTYQPPPTLQEYEPIYTPLSLCSNRSLSNKDSLQRMDFRHDIVPHRNLLTKTDSSHRVSSPLPLKGNQEGHSQRRHRRVKSIGDINASLLPT